ncbi:VirD4-like conjugal transfer protein, CD1115 family [Lactobacillus sp. AN1001]
MIDVLLNFLGGFIRASVDLFVRTQHYLVEHLLLSIFVGLLLSVLFYLGYMYLTNRNVEKKEKRSFFVLDWFDQIVKAADQTNSWLPKPLLQIKIFIVAIINVIGIVLVVAAVHILNLFPFWNRRRKKLKKEVKPTIRFQTWQSFIAMFGAFDIFGLLLTCYLAGLFREGIDSVINFSFDPNKAYQFDLTYLYFEKLLNFNIFRETPILAIPIFLLLSFLAFKASWVNWQQHRDYNNHESGDDRFATLNELKHQYTKIADRGETYKGISGVPVAHMRANSIQGLKLGALMLYNNETFSKVIGEIERKAKLSHYKAGYYLIEQAAINMLMVGTTRSGKGEGWVNTIVDIASRAEDQASLIVGDPKLELGQMAYKTLCKRGYDVQILSFQNMDFSMSYNPLTLAVEAAKKGYYEKVQARVNAVAEAIYRKPKKNSSGNDEYWENTSISLFNAIALALIDRANEAYEAGEKDAWDTVTIRNLVTFLTELGSETSYVDANNESVDADDENAIKKGSLTLYFDKLREANEVKYSKFREMADINFRTSDFAGEETRGNIYSSMTSGLNLFLQDNIARLTSKNTIDLANFGNPRRLTIRFRSSSNSGLPNAYAFQRATLNFYEERQGRLSKRLKPKLIIKNARATIDEAGYMTYVVRKKLPERFIIVVTFRDSINGTEVQDHFYKFSCKKTYKTNENGGFEFDEYTKEKILTGVDTTLLQKSESTIMDKESVDFVYSEKPIALFIGIPPNRNEYGPLATLLIDQLFNVNYEVALDAGRKNVRRIHFLLDEFTNLPAIPKIGQKLSIALGQNFQFTLFVQAIAQLIEKYGQEEANTIMGNCSLMGLIKTSLHETNEIFSKMLGKKTVTIRDKSTNPLKEADPHINEKAIEQDLMTPTQLARMESGEAVLIRTVKSHDLKGHKVTNDPILLMGKTEMPMRYMFLHEEFDQKTTMADIAIKAEHSGLDLSDISVAPTKTLDGLEMWVNGLKNKKADNKFPVRPARIKQKPNNISELKNKMLDEVG